MLSHLWIHTHINRQSHVCIAHINHVTIYWKRITLDISDLCVCALLFIFNKWIRVKFHKSKFNVNRTGFCLPSYVCTKPWQHTNDRANSKKPNTDAHKERKRKKRDDNLFTVHTSETSNISWNCNNIAKSAFCHCLPASEMNFRFTFDLH